MGKSRKKPPPPKNDERRKRVETIYDLIILGAELTDLRDYSVGQNWNATPAELVSYRNEALKLIEANAPRDRNQARARHLLQRRAIYARAMEGGDWGTALSVARDEARLLGLYDLKEPIEEEAEPPSEAEIVKRLGEIADRIGGERGQRIIAQIGGGTPVEAAEPADAGGSRIRGQEEASRGSIGEVDQSGPGDREDTADR